MKYDDLVHASSFHRDSLSNFFLTTEGPEVQGACSGNKVTVFFLPCLCTTYKNSTADHFLDNRKHVHAYVTVTVV